MLSNATYVFLDLGTTNDPTDVKVKIITELSMTAVRRDRLLDCGLWYVDDNLKYWQEFSPPVPRVQLKLTLCFNPGTGQELNSGGFSLADLKPEKTFDESFDLINDFLNILTDPVYFVAYNGFNFDFPILKGHLKGKSFSKDIMCVDAFYGFYDILENRTYGAARFSYSDDKPKRSAEESMKHLQELRQANANRILNQRFPWGSISNRPSKSYKLSDVYAREMNNVPEDAHKGDIDCQLMLRIAVKLSKKFVAWADENHSSFAEHVEPRSSRQMDVMPLEGTGEMELMD